MSLLGFDWESPEILDRIEELMGPFGQSPEAEAAALVEVDRLLAEKHAVSPYTPPWSQESTEIQEYKRTPCTREYGVDRAYRESLPRATRLSTVGGYRGQSRDAEAKEAYREAG